MGTKAVPQPPFSPDLAPCDFCLFPKLRGCRYETIEEMKEAVTKAIDTLTQEDFHGVFQKLLERYECITARGDYFEGDWDFMCVLSIKVPIRKKSGNLFNDPRKRLFLETRPEMRSIVGMGRMDIKSNTKGERELFLSNTIQHLDFIMYTNTHSQREKERESVCVCVGVIIV